MFLAQNFTGLLYQSIHGRSQGIPDICHFSPHIQFWTQFVSTQYRVNCDKTDFAKNCVNCHKTDFTTSVMWKNLKFLQIWQLFTFLHICCVENLKFLNMWRNFRILHMYLNLKFLHMTDFFLHLYIYRWRKIYIYRIYR